MRMISMMTMMTIWMMIFHHLEATLSPTHHWEDPRSKADHLAVLKEDLTTVHKADLQQKDLVAKEGLSTPSSTKTDLPRSIPDHPRATPDHLSLARTDLPKPTPDHSTNNFREDHRPCRTYKEDLEFNHFRGDHRPCRTYKDLREHPAPALTATEDPQPLADHKIPFPVP